MYLGRDGQGGKDVAIFGYLLTAEASAINAPLGCDGARMLSFLRQKLPLLVTCAATAPFLGRVRAREHHIDADLPSANLTLTAQHNNNNNNNALKIGPFKWPRFFSTIQIIKLVHTIQAVSIGPLNGRLARLAGD